MKRYATLIVLIAAVTLLSNCGKDDPEEPNLKEEIGSVGISIDAPGGSEELYILFEDPDGDGEFEALFGGVEPVLTANKIYNANILIYNMSSDLINAEINSERGDHLFCFSSTNSIMSFNYNGSEDDSGKPFGVNTTWTTGESGDGNITVTLRHQPGTKSGDCPGEGEDDFTVTFPLHLSE